jgi:hypothetical protein
VMPVGETFAVSMSCTIGMVSSIIQV